MYQGYEQLINILLTILNLLYNVTLENNNELVSSASFWLVFLPYGPTM